MALTLRGGTLNFNFHTNNTHSSLHHAIILDRGYRRPDEGFFLRAESFYNVATQLERYKKMFLIPIAIMVVNHYTSNHMVKVF